MNVSLNKKEALEKAKSLSGNVKNNFYIEIYKENTQQTLFEVSQQALNSMSERKAVDRMFGKEIVDLALILYPNTKLGEKYYPVVDEGNADDIIFSSGGFIDKKLPKSEIIGKKFADVFPKLKLQTPAMFRASLKNYYAAKKRLEENNYVRINGKTYDEKVVSHKESILDDIKYIASIKLNNAGTIIDMTDVNELEEGGKIKLFRGEGSIKSSETEYFTPSENYAKWFAKKNNGTVKSEIIETKELLDLRCLGNKTTFKKIKNLLDEHNIVSPNFVLRNLITGYGDATFYVWQVANDLLKDMPDIKGIIIKENNPEAKHLGVVDAYLFNKSNFENGGGIVNSNPTYLMTLEEYQKTVTPILQEYYKFTKKNWEYFVASDYHGVLYITFDELLSDIKKGTQTDRFRRDEYDKNTTSEQHAKKNFSYFKTGKFNEEYEPIPVPKDIVEKKNEYLDKLRKYFTEEEIVKRIERDETKSNKRSVRRAIDNDTYKKLLEEGTVSLDVIEKAAASVGVSLPKKIFSQSTIKTRENQAIYDKIYASMPTVNKDVLSKMVDDIKETFKPLEKIIYERETERYQKLILSTLDKNEADIHKLYADVHFYDKIFIYQREERKRKAKDRYNRDVILTDNWIINLSLKIGWKEVVSKVVLAEIEELKANMIFSIIDNFKKITQPIESISQIALQVGVKGFEGSYRFKFKNGSSFIFRTEAIGAGGYNIQKYHFRYLTHFLDITLADGTKDSGRYGIIENFSVKDEYINPYEKIDNYKSIGEIASIVYDTIKTGNIEFKNSKDLQKNWKDSNSVTISFNPNQFGKVALLKLDLSNRNSVEVSQILAKRFLKMIGGVKYKPVPVIQDKPIVEDKETLELIENINKCETMLTANPNDTETAETLELLKETLAEKTKKMEEGGAVATNDSVVEENKKTEVLYSPFEKFLNNNPQKTFTTEQLLGQLKSLPQAELEWIGLKNFLYGKTKVTKDELIDFFNKNKVVINFIYRGGGKEIINYDNAPKEVQELMDKFQDEQIEQSEFADEMKKLGYDVCFGVEGELESITSEYKEPTKYAKYVLNGDVHNYRELLITMPDKEKEYRLAENEKMFALNERVQKRLGIEKDTVLYNVFNILDYRNKGLLTDEELSVVAEIFDKNNPYKSFTTHHWDERNIIAHVRMDDRTTVDDKKILLIEEVQSDWANSIRKKGVFKTFNKATSEKEPRFDGRYWYVYNKSENEMVSPQSFTSEDAAWKSIKSSFDLYNNGESDMPFKHNWLELVTKKVIQIASQEGYDGIAWINGLQTAERYSLDKEYDKIISYKNENGTYDLTLFPKGESLQTPRDINGVLESNLERYVGKEIADRILKSEINVEGQVVLQGEQLKVESGWARNLYDTQIPKLAQKYVKQYGGKITDFGFYFNNSAGVSDKDVAYQFGIEITTEMREKTKSLPMFIKGGNLDGDLILNPYAKKVVVIKDGEGDKIKFKEGGQITDNVKSYIDKFAAMTFDEFFDYSTLYQIESYDDKNTWDESRHKDIDRLKKYPLLVKKINVGGKEIEFRKDDEKLMYVASDEKGDIKRDEKGMALYMPDEELKAKGIPMYETTIYAFHGNKVVGWCADSWGVPELFYLYLISEDGYFMRKKGFLGQYTEDGVQAIKKLYKKFVEESKKFVQGGAIHKSVGLEGNLVGKSKNPYIGKETEITCHDKNIRCFVSDDTYRFVYVVNGKNVSALHIDKHLNFYVIRNMFTAAKYRRKGYAENLYIEAKKHINHLEFSKNLSADGKEFKKHIVSSYEKGGGIKNNELSIKNVIKELEKVAKSKPTIKLVKKNVTSSQLTEILKTIGKDSNFIKYANEKGQKNYIIDSFDSYSLTHGFCNPLTYYIMDRYNGLDAYSAKNNVDGNHLFLKLNDKYYDAKNVHGVDEPSQFDFFTNKNNITIKLLESEHIPDISEAYHKAKLVEKTKLNSEQKILIQAVERAITENPNNKKEFGGEYRSGGEMNPYAVCTVSVGKTSGTQERSKWTPAQMHRYENCVLKVKDKMQRGGEIRTLLYTDEHGKKVVYENDCYKIAVDDINDAKYITLWHNGKRVGVLEARVKYLEEYHGYSGKFLSVEAVYVDSPHRDKGYGLEMYKALQKYSKDDVIGFLSYLPNRANKKSIPKIYSHFKNVIVGDFQIVTFHDGGIVNQTAYFAIENSVERLMVVKYEINSDEVIKRITKMVDTATDLDLRVISITKEEYEEYDLGDETTLAEIEKFISEFNDKAEGGTEYKTGGEVSPHGEIVFDQNRIPDKDLYQYALMVKNDYPKVWKSGTMNVFSEQAFKNLGKVVERGFWMDYEKPMYIKWQKFTKMYKSDDGKEDVILNLKWLSVVDKGVAYMKKMIDKEIESKYPDKIVYL